MTVRFGAFRNAELLRHIIARDKPYAPLLRRVAEQCVSPFGAACTMPRGVQRTWQTTGAP